MSTDDAGDRVLAPVVAGQALAPERLKPDCANCDGLCCFAPRFEWPHYHKPGASACQNLDLGTMRCRIFERLEVEGYTTCRSWDCFGAGPAVTRLFREIGRTWRDDPEVAALETAVFAVVWAELHNHVYPARTPKTAPCSVADIARAQPLIDVVFKLLAEPLADGERPREVPTSIAIDEARES